jgi:AraC-like DNA-binding protein
VTTERVLLFQAGKHPLQGFTSSCVTFGLSDMGEHRGSLPSVVLLASVQDQLASHANWQFSVSIAHLDVIARQWRGGNWKALLDVASFPVAAPAFAHLRSCAVECSTSTEMQCSDRLASILAFEVPTALIHGFLTSNGTARTSRRRRARDNGLVRAVRFVEQYSHEPLMLHDLEDAAHVSPRTLNYAFQDLFGLSPMRYLKYHRLHRAHRALRRADAAEVNVTQLAGECGFWHMGQFGSDYRALYGECPSVTLRCEVDPTYPSNRFIH